MQRKAASEKLSRKVSGYITPAELVRLSEMVGMDNCSIAEFIRRLIQKEFAARQPRPIQAVRKS
jgi:hypothetical protein